MKITTVIIIIAMIISIFLLITVWVHKPGWKLDNSIFCPEKKIAKLTYRKDSLFRHSKKTIIFSGNEYNDLIEMINNHDGRLIDRLDYE